MKIYMRQLYRRTSARLLLIVLTLALVAGDPLPPNAPDLTNSLYLPMIRNGAAGFRTARRVNLPYYSDAEITKTRFKEMAIFWFGRVTPSENYTDVRIAYNNDALWVYLAVFDRRLWYDTTPAPDDLMNWDSAALFLDISSTPPGSLGANSYQFQAQFTQTPEASQRINYQRALRGNGNAWQPAALNFSTISGWRGSAPNNNNDDKGWAMTFIIPYASLGWSGKPPEGTLIRLGLQTNDRDAGTGALAPTKFWPDGFRAEQPATWGEARFGLPTYSSPPSTLGGTVQIRHRLNGLVVDDASVGGYALCGDGSDFFATWGDTTERFYNSSGSDYNVQNQADVADFPCFSKIYLNFPLSSIPQGKVIRQARLILHQFGNAGGTGQALPSIIQVHVVSAGWTGLDLTWNNAPLAEENVSRAQVDPLATPLPWPGAAREWDVTYAVAQAFARGLTQLNLALYSADGAYHSGKYFVSSDTGDWNAAGRPTLEITWGEP